MHCIHDFALPVLGEHLHDRLVLILVVKMFYVRLYKIKRVLDKQSKTGVVRVKLFDQDTDTLINTHELDFDHETKCYRFVLNNVHKNSNYRYVVQTNFLKGRIEKSFVIKNNKRKLFVACDNNETLFGSGGWDMLKDTADAKDVTQIVHIGDQVYMDSVFTGVAVTVSRTVKSDTELINCKRRIKDKFYDVYVRSFSDSSKGELLATRTNIMIGDDHEVSDDRMTVSTFWVSPETRDLVKSVAREVYNEIQLSLRIRTNEDTDKDLYHSLEGSTLFIYLGRTYESDPDQQKYANYIKETVDKYEDHINRIVLCPTVPWFISTSSYFFIRYFYGEYDPTVYYPIYDVLEEIAEKKKVRIVSGDLHAFVKARVKLTHNSNKVTVIPMDIAGCVRGCLNTITYIFVKCAIPVLGRFFGSIVTWRDGYGGLYYDGVKDSVVHVTRTAYLAKIFNEFYYAVLYYFKLFFGDKVLKQKIKDVLNLI